MGVTIVERILFYSTRMETCAFEGLFRSQGCSLLNSDPHSVPLLPPTAHLFLVSLGTQSLLVHMAGRVHVAKLLSPHRPGCPMFALLGACVRRHRTLCLRNGTPGCDGPCSAGCRRCRCEIPGASEASE